MSDRSTESAEQFVHLHVHTEFSLLDGLCKIDRLVERARELGMGALAITDHGAMHGVITFYRACKKAGIKPIIGMEGYLAHNDRRIHDQSEKSPFHLLLLARNQTGYKNLLKLASAAQLEGFYHRPRIDKELLAAHAEGLICTTGCLAAEVPRLILDGREDEARRMIGWYQDVFGKENFFLELQHHDIPQLREVNTWLYENQDYANAPLVATNDTHYVRYEDYDAHDTLLCIQTSTLKSDEKRMRMTDPSYHLRSPGEMWELFAEVPEALTNTLRIAEMCEIDLETKGYHLPVFPVPPGYDAERYLRSLARRGLRWRYGERADHPVVRERLAHELRIIHDMGFDTYFLIVWDLCQFARHADIWWNVRGSAAGSVTAYSLGITNIDPLENNLIFERFLNPGRVSMPDIDLDFPDDRRMEMIEYAMRKYGSDRVAAIITFGTLKARAAIKDVGRVLGYPLNEVNSLTQYVPNIPSRPVTLAECIGSDEERAVPALREMYENDERIRKLLDTAITVEGVARNAGTHAAGVIIGDKPLVEYLPLHRPIGDTPLEQVTQFPMEVCESIGLLKVDFLGLSTLTIMRKACELIKKYHGIQYTMDNIPYRPDPDDPESTARVERLFELIGNGETTGVFQLESAGMKRMLVEMKPQTFEHVVAAISLYRPGPMALIPQYIRRMHGEEAVTYHHPLLEPILKETYSIIVYQEQIQQIAASLFGYSLGDADLMRRAVSKKKIKALMEHKERFKGRGPERGVPVEVAEKIFDEIEYFAAYGFNKCVGYNTEIVDAATGRLCRVGDLAAGKVRIEHTLTCNVDRLRLGAGRVSGAYENGVKPVYRLTTNLGRQIEATANHPFYTFSGWRMLGDLRADDKIAVPRTLPVVGRREWPEHEVIVLGHLLAEGNLCHPHGVYYYTHDAEQWRDYVENLEKFDNTAASTHRRRGKAHDVYSRRLDPRRPNGVVAWIERLGLRHANARTKFIPEAAFELTNRQIALLIARMWEGDGNIDEKSRFVYYATASERLARQLQHLLLRFGIISRLRQVRFAYKEGRVGYQLHVTGSRNLNRFNQHIAPHLINLGRRAALARMALRYAQTPGTKACVPAKIRDVVGREKAALGVTWDRVAGATGVSMTEFQKPSNHAKSGFTHAVIGRLAANFDSDELRLHADNDIYWDTITSIEYLGEQPTYDLTIEGTHNFIANDILVHNSHAADYAVLTCQTAYLKAHYPEEYYTALLSVQRHNIADVALFTSDCRRFGIPILPPDVNASDLDFTIETLEDGRRGIRYGLSAIKNAGEKAIQQIIDGRGDAPFRDISDLCRRVDLRAVGKRALESLIKVGALDSLGDRDQLLRGADRMIKFSGDHHHAQEIGQISLFGSEGSGESLNLPRVPETERSTARERMRWEKELVGLYVSEHPLHAVIQQVQQLPNLQYADTLLRESEEFHDRPATLVGLVVGLRTLQTRRNEEMAVLTLEDMTGSINCVLFPRTWSQYRALVHEDALLIVRGKADASRGEMQIVVDNVSEDFTLARAADRPAPQAAGDLAGEPGASMGVVDDENVGEDGLPNALFRDAAPPDSDARSAAEEAAPAAVGRHRLAAALADLDSHLDALDEEAHGDSGLPPCRVTITIRRTGDIAKDRRRVNRVRNKLNEYPGPDQFCIRLLNPDGKAITLEYPGCSTQYVGEVENFLASLFDPADILVEPLTAPSGMK